ncbi:TPA: hypothetical protein DEP34_00965 [Candidatus Uhrbacteria bacterium]|uniref:AtpZ/AtpI family protein n=2 Tax=Candidatus Uhriibacteriota TaxID=1752732 RepID=A0A0G1Q7D9_9BACT|nr:MAG: hypothetical protein UX45_C0023G0007 [Candidatus Uhrbacteria bacterium GW2011_GWF2_46_218]KKU40981.1 MAG: hypothetical protein UX57_C0007G0013 [Candidatus Uhrbacteria bacterium GW2011_GWE2_46_68]HBK33659.1 hypothetical protein [Candidatus Uhrbacteria bacterium]HCB18942.1 hypothetical protein [Candidatus Uhrbacteria bacterium]
MSNEAVYYRLAMRIFADFGITIAIPSVGAALLGSWLDDRYETEPRYLIILLILALVLTAFSIYRKATYYGRVFNSLSNPSDKTSSYDDPSSRR